MEFTQEEIKVLKLDRMTREICSLPKEKFPEYLFTPVHSVVAYDDENYHSRITDENLRSVMKLKRRYNNFFQWVDAMEIYNSYKDYIEDTYGSFKKVVKGMKKGYYSIYIPDEPKLKKTRDNRTLLSSGILPSRTVEKIDIQEWATHEFDRADAKTPQAVKDQITTEGLYYYEPTKEERKKAQKAARLSRQNQRLANIYLDDNMSSGMNIINDFYNPNRKRVGSDGKYGSGFSLAQAMKEYEEQQLMYDWELMEDFKDDYVYMNGRHVERKDAEALEIVKELAQEGWDVNKIIGSANLGTASMKMLKNEMGLQVPMSKKELKKWKKEKKKQDEAMRRKKRSDAALVNSLTSSNKLQRTYNEDDILDITFESFYND